MKKFRTLRIILSTLVIIILGIYLFNIYDKRHFLTNGVLHLKQNPTTLQIVECETWGISDFRAEYYVLIDKNDITTLLKGRKYVLTPNPKDYFISWATHAEDPKFNADVCYTSGSMSDGLVNIFLNKDKSEAYIVYSAD